MADEDEIIEPEDLDLAPELDDAVDVLEVDPDELDEEDLVDEPFGDLDDEFADVEVEEDEAETDGPVRRTVVSDDDDDDDMIAPDDVEADLDAILKDRLVSAEESEDEDEDEPEDRSDPGDRLQPKRADERLCPSCFLLVRNGAPICPIGDDDCPLFSV
jgi:hypothetical protein